MILVDAGPLIADADHGDADHAVCHGLLASAMEPLLVPSPILAETCYMLDRAGGARLEAQFLRLFTRGYLTLGELAAADLGRMAKLVEQYGDLPLGGADASVVALAERHGITTLMTLDRRHFSVVRPRHVGALTLLP